MSTEQAPQVLRRSAFVRVGSGGRLVITVHCRQVFVEELLLRRFEVFDCAGQLGEWGFFVALLESAYEDSELVKAKAAR